MNDASAISVVQIRAPAAALSSLKTAAEPHGVEALEEETRRGALRDNLMHLPCPSKDHFAILSAYSSWLLVFT